MARFCTYRAAPKAGSWFPCLTAVQWQGEVGSLSSVFTVLGSHRVLQTSTILLLLLLLLLMLLLLTNLA